MVQISKLKETNYEYIKEKKLTVQSKTAKFSRSKQITIFKCQFCDTNYYCPPTRCKKKGCDCIRFKKLETDSLEEINISSSF